MTPDRLAPMQPMNRNTIEGTNVPVNSLPVVMRNNSQLANKPGTIPPHPQVTAPLAGIPLGFQFAFNQLVSPTVYGNQIDSYRIYRNTSANAFSGSQLIRTIRHDPTHLGAVTVQDSVAGGKQYYYFVTAVDTTGQESKPGAFQSSAVTSGNANPNITQATAITANPSTTSSSFSVLTDMSVTLTTKGHSVLITFSGAFAISGNTGLATAEIAIFRDASQISDIMKFGAPTSWAGAFPLLLTWIDAPSSASHTYDVRWLINGSGTLANDTTNRSLQVVELG